MAILGTPIASATVTVTTSVKNITEFGIAAALRRATLFLTITANGGAVLYTVKGEDPNLSNGTGHILNSGETVTIIGNDSIEGFRFIIYTGSPKLYGTVYTAVKP